MIALAHAGFRAITPDYRGYGLSDLPAQPEEASFLELDNDLLAILDALAIPKVFLIGKDFGAWPVYIFAGLHPERTLGVVTMGVPYMPKSSRPMFQDDRNQVAGQNLILDALMRKQLFAMYVYILFSRSKIPIAAENQEIMDLVDSSMPHPPWFTEEDLEAYGKLYEKFGFQTALQPPYSET